jgi:hypothetical protein
MGRKEQAPGEPTVRNKPPSVDQPATDTSTDWDEWMERQGGQPGPISDVADAEGRFTEVTTPAATRPRRGRTRRPR